MNRSGVSAPALRVLAGVLLLAGCGRGGGEERGALADTARMDTTNQQEMDGLSREQIQQRARAMSPAQAEALGIVDTTIHVENLDNPGVLELPPVEEARPDSGG
jgi:hypothetical protein